MFLEAPSNRENCNTRSQSSYLVSLTFEYRLNRTVRGKIDDQPLLPLLLQSKAGHQCLALRKSIEDWGVGGTARLKQASSEAFRLVTAVALRLQGQRSGFNEPG